MILYNTLTAMLVQVRHAQVSGGGGASESKLSISITTIEMQDIQL